MATLRSICDSRYDDFLTAACDLVEEIDSSQDRQPAHARVRLRYRKIPAIRHYMYSFPFFMTQIDYGILESMRHAESINVLLGQVVTR